LLAVGEQDRRLVRYKLPRVGHFVHANGLDRVTIGQRQPGLLGIVTAGKAYLDVMGGLAKLRITPAVAEALGVSVLKLACVYPVSARTVLEFSHAAREVIVIEEKRPQIETQVAACLYNNPARPQLSGKHDPQGTPLIDADDPLTPLSVALAIGARLKSLGVPLPAQVIEALKGIETSAMGSSSPAGLVRLANYCAGCPHNTSTTPPEGGVVLTGVGCHSLVQFLDRTHVPVTQMGGEGANWLGIAPFASPGHAFANLGDGTYNHSGSLAIRAAVQANMTMTFRILLNDAIAMTGGQKIGPGLSPGQIIEQLLAEKVSAVFVASDEPGLVQVPRSNRVRVFDRIDLPAVYEDCRNTPGVSVLLYVQRCATEKRRDRKRGQLPQPSERIMINDLVCEGCGDCSVQSNCMAILPKETEFGRKRAIDQAACNVDQSCLRGFCPSFVTVEGQLRKPARELSEFETALAALPECAPAPMGESFGILAAGVGGSGVVTFGAVLAMAAHMEGLGSTTYDMTGLSQKGGAVFSHIRFLRRSDIDLPTRIGAQEADLLFGFDLVSAAQVEGLQSIAEGTTSVFCDRYVSPTAAFHKQRDLSFTPAPLLERLAGRKPKYLGDFDASDIARRTLGDPVFASMILLGLALQRGDVPLSGHAIEAAIKLNGAEVEANIRALRLGRLLCLEPHRLQNSHAGAPAAGDIHEALILRIKELADYQNSAYAARYREIVETALEADRRLGNDRQDLTWAVVRNAFKVMAYKDEYEVARLFTDGRFARQMAETFADGAKMSFHLAPPLLAQTDRVTGRPRKLRFGSWMRHGFQILSHLRWLRDTRFDPFGRAPERVLERRLRDAYLAWAGTLTSLQGHDYAAALKVARIPDDVRGFGPVKAAALTAALQQLEEAMMAATASSPAAVD
jgi:indolepyruvate ferredoxin oxidoreductase